MQDVFGERVKIYKAWKDGEAMLNKKREEKNRLELARKLDKVPPVAQECTRVSSQEAFLISSYHYANYEAVRVVYVEDK